MTKRELIAALADKGDDVTILIEAPRRGVFKLGGLIAAAGQEPFAVLFTVPMTIQERHAMWGLEAVEITPHNLASDAPPRAVPSKGEL
jgi:hypothetical protein